MGPKITDFCVEIRPVFEEPNKIEYDVLINLKSRIRPDSMVVTSPEFREVLDKTDAGKKIKESVQRIYSSGMKTGAVSFFISNDKITHGDLFPFRGLFHGTKLESIFRGTRLGTFVETRILKSLKGKFPGKLIIHRMAAYDQRQEQLKKIGVPKEHLHGAVYQWKPLKVEENYLLFKKFLKKDRQKRLQQKPK